MSKRIVLQYPHRCLLQECVPVDPENVLQMAHIRKIVLPKMKMAMRMCDGVGIAANQLGYDFRMFSYQWDGKYNTLINPELFDYSEEREVADEGCLSVVGMSYPVTRHARVSIKGLDENLEEQTIHATGYLARIFQHEVDHLAGVILLDRVEK